MCGDGVSAAAIGNGLMSPRVQICAGHQANMIFRLILGIGEA
jgi:sulfur carrier protein ThiS adenylyltransferase